MILIIDNYDSFTWNLVQSIELLGKTVIVKHNDSITVSDVDKMNPSRIIISPGPGTPIDSGISVHIIHQFMHRIPILGVCLGHQCIGSVFDVGIRQSTKILHGKTSLIHHNTIGLLKGIPTPFQAARYHSLSLESVPNDFYKTAWTNDGEIMGIQHKSFNLYGVQFHPESFLTPVGSHILENFLNE